MEEEKKKTTFLFVFLTYLPVFLLQFQWRELVGCRIKFCIQRVPTQYTFDEPFTPKNNKFLKNVMMMSSSLFLGISYFWGRGVRKKYAKWVFIGFRIKFCIQWALPIEIWVKAQGDMSKIQTKKVVFLWYLCPNLY